MGITFAATPIVVPSVSEGSPTEGRFAKQSRKRPRAGERRLTGDFKPRRETRASHHQATTKPPHAPLGVRIDFKGTSVGLFLDLTQVGIPLASIHRPKVAPKGPLWVVRARRGGYAGCGSRVGKRRVNFHGARNRAPPDPTEKRLLTHHHYARNRKRSARLAAEGR